VEKVDLLWEGTWFATTKSTFDVNRANILSIHQEEREKKADGLYNYREFLRCESNECE
jgi:hypothetical protein